MSETVTIEDRVGKFHFRRERKGRKIKQKLKRALKNKAKVTLGWIGELEVYCYPHKFPDHIFMGNFPFKGAKLDITEIRTLIKAWKRCRSYLRGVFKKRGTSARRVLNKELLAAYNYGLEEDERLKKVKIPNSITTTDSGLKMPVRPGREITPKTDYNKWLDQQKEKWAGK